MSDFDFPPCIDCGVELGSMPDGRCSSCAMDYLISAGACRECHTAMLREDWFGPRASQHVQGCSLATSDDCAARTPDELKAVRIARCGWAP